MYDPEVGVEGLGGKHGRDIDEKNTYTALNLKWKTSKF